MAVITAALFIALGCGAARPDEEPPLSADFSLPPGEVWTRFMWESFAASPSTLLLMPCTLRRSPGGPQQVMAWSIWEQSSRWTSHSKLTLTFLDQTPGAAPTTVSNPAAWGCSTAGNRLSPPKISFLEQPMLVFSLVTSFSCCLELVGQQHRSAEGKELL